MNAAADNNGDGGRKPGFFARLKQRLGGGKGSGLGFGWLSGRKLDEELEEEIEERLLLADVGVAATDRLMEGLRGRLKRGGGNDGDAMQTALREEILTLLEPRAQPLQVSGAQPFVILMVGVNGSGKTTTIGKLARFFKQQGLSVMLAAGDTYRAAATEQLQAWGERNDVTVVAQQQGADPAAVIFDALEAARSRGTDVVLADTAGRLQNQEGLMRELQKIVRVAARFDEHAPHEIMLVLDASLGQNALAQARQFSQAVGVSGITLTKLDGGGRGGILLAIASELDIPFRFLGMGEQADDMAPFDAEKFVDALLEVSDGQRE